MNFLHKNIHKCKSPEPSRKIKLETLLVLNLTHSPLGHVLTIAQYTHDVVLTSVRRRFNVMNVVWMSKRCRVLTGQRYLSLTFLLSFSFGFQLILTLRLILSLCKRQEYNINPMNILIVKFVLVHQKTPLLCKKNIAKI